MLFSITKQTSPKLPSQLMLMDGVISGIVTPKYKTKSNPFARKKSGSYENLWNVSTFLVFPKFWKFSIFGILKSSTDSHSLVTNPSYVSLTRFYLMTCLQSVLVTKAKNAFVKNFRHSSFYYFNHFISYQCFFIGIEQQLHYEKCLP